MRKWLYIAVVAAPLPLMAQNDDRSFLEGLLEDNLSGAGRVVQVQGFSGALSSVATIETLTIADDTGVWLTLKGVTLNWSRTALLSGRLDVAELSAQELILPRGPVVPDSLPDAEATPLQLPDLPVSVSIGKLEVVKAELGAALLGQDSVMSLTGTATLANGEGQAALSVTRTSPQAGSVLLSASYSNTTRNLALDLSLDEPQNGLAAQLMGLPGQPALTLRVNGDGPLEDFTANLELGSDGVPRLTGQVRLTKPADVAQFDAQIAGDIAPLFAPEYRPFFGPQMQIAAKGARDADGRVTLDQLSLQADALTVSGRATLGPDGWPELARLNAELAPRNGDTVLLPISGAPTRVSGAKLALDYDAGRGDGWTLAATLDGLARDSLSLQSARIDANGTLTPGHVDGRAEVALQGLDPQDQALAEALGRDLRAALTFDWAPGQPLGLERVTLAGTGLTLDGSARISTLPRTADVQIVTDATLTTPDLARFAALAGQPLAGGGNLRVNGWVQPVSGAFDLAITGATQDLAVGQPMLDPLLAGTAALDVAATRDATGIALKTLHIASDHARIDGTGSLSAQSAAGHVSAQVTDLARILPQLSGAAALNADLTRSGETWDVSLQASAPGQAKARLTATATGQTWADLSVAGTLDTSAEALNAYAALTGQDLSGAVQLSVSGTVQPAKLSFETTAHANGRNLATGLPQLDQLLRGKSQVTITAARDAEGLLSLTSAELETPEITLNATSETGETLEFSTRLRDLGLLASGLSGPATAKGTIALEDRDWRLDITGDGPGQTNMAAKGTIRRDGKSVNLSLAGVAPMALANDLIRPRSLSGLVRYDLTVNGAPVPANISGTISARDGRFALPNEGVALEGLNADITLSGGQAQVSAQARLSSNGALSVSGPISLAAPYQANLTGTLTDAYLSDPQLYETYLGGDFRVTGPLAGGAQLGGRITLGQTELRVPNPSGTNYADLPGLRHVAEPAAVYQTRVNAGMVSTEVASAASGPVYGLDIQVIAPERIFVRGRGLDAELGGSLRLTGTTRDVVPQGRFDLIRGRLDILGKRLTLSEGLIRLQGAFDPYVRFVASTTAADTTASIVIEGQASAPGLTFASSPELPQDEVLALILFGKEISMISPLQAVRLAAAVRTLTGVGGDGVGGRIRKELTLDDLDVTTSEDGATEARAGKYLSENIYSEVTADTEGNSQINLNLSINRTVTARGRLSSDGETGLGIFIEKDY